MKRLHEKFGAILLIGIMMNIEGYANFLSTPTATFYTTRASERLGYNVHRAGDVNGDGIDDFMIATSHYNVGGWDRGAVNIFLGKTEKYTGTIHIDAANGRWIGHAASDALGWDLGCGDFNGDGFSDILIGAPSGASDTNPGYAYIIFGKADPNWNIAMDIWTTADVRLVGESAVSVSGTAVSSVGDMDGDGCDEFIVSAKLYDGQGYTDRGCVYFFKGKSTGWTTPISMGNADAIFLGPSTSAGLGSWASDAGDVNGDGIPDFMFGSLTKNIYLIYGRSAMDWGKSYSASNADVIFTLNNNYIGNSGSLDRAGDVNGDGYDDILISDVSYSSYKGIVYLITGRQSFTSPFSVSNATASYPGLKANDAAGFWTAGGFDYNYDGYSDFLFGTHGYDNGSLTDAGAAYMVQGKSSGWTQNVTLSTLPDVGSNSKENSQFGECVGVLGDVNNDGVEDVAISAPYWGTNTVQYATGWGMGRVYLYYNEPPVSSPEISGTCTYANTGLPIQNVKINVTGSATVTRISNASGEYQYTGAQLGSYHCVPTKTLGESSDGIITSYDAGLIARYCLSLGTLDAEQLAAADVNQDGAVTIYDAIGISRFIVGAPTISGFLTGRWSFSPTSRDYTAITSDQTGQDYQGYLLGNVSGNWTGSSTSKSIAINCPFEISVDQQTDNSTVTLWYSGDAPFYAADFKFDLPEDITVSVQKHGSNDALYLFANRVDGKCRISTFTVNSIHGNSALFNIVTDAKAGSLEAILESIQYCLNDADHYESDIGNGSQTNGNPTRFSLGQNYPNPFNAGTIIRYDLNEPAFVSAVVYNSLGERVAELISSRQSAGHYELHWDGQDKNGAQAPSGLYLFRLQAGTEQKIIKLMKID